jgi:hypothetical protein
MAGQVDTSSHHNDVFEDAADGGTAHTLHRLRANSSIMEMKKILGKLLTAFMPL